MKLFSIGRIVVIACFLAFSGESFGQPDVMNAAEKDFKKADSEMNAVYQKALVELAQDSDHGKILIADFKKAQRAWLTFRDAEAACRAGVTSNGGSAYTMNYLANLTSLTLHRTKDLSELLLDKTLKHAMSIMDR